MIENQTISSLVREEIPKILKNIKDVDTGLRFNELFEKLKEEFPDKLVNENDEDRIGVLRGIVNKLDNIPIKNVRTEKRGKEVFFVYVSDNLTELSRTSKRFLNDLSQRGLVSIDVLQLEKNEREFYQKFIQTIISLEDILRDFEEQRIRKN
ncbi:hypothetical protein PDN14_29035 [Bacillus cereus group sp. Bc222]|uniref:hypothetical protein n=1 Tax=Bacillus cereus group sp. Bc222 TaxID=3018111 RepID=UPI0022E5DCA1|nr:hypothetical protein [Bacillus cereus group sp. Bc222]MDA2242394.1 hypothetical protein [Bacillus cereus group sp. Bc222]